MNPLGLQYLKPTWKFLTIYCAWIAFELFIVAWFYIETKGPTLEEIAKIFDGDHAETGIASLGDVKADMRIADVMEKFGNTTTVEVPMYRTSSVRTDSSDRPLQKMSPRIEVIPRMPKIPRKNPDNSSGPRRMNSVPPRPPRSPGPSPESF